MGLWRGFQALLPLGIVLALVLLGIGGVWLRLDAIGRRRAGIAFVICWSVGLLAVTLRPRPDLIDASGHAHSRWIDLMPFSEIGDSLANAVTWQVAVEQVVGNVVLFLPLGAAVTMMQPYRRRAWLGSLVAGGCVGVAIEAAQWALGVGRVSSVDDVILAALGGVLGSLVVRPLAGKASAQPDRGRPPIAHRD